MVAKGTRTICRHCGAEPVCRPRGLGWKCYYTPAVRALYPSESPYCPKGKGGRTGELTDAEVLALKPVVFGDFDPPPPGEYAPPAAAPALGDWMGQWDGVGAGGWYDLHPDTDPAAVALTHLWLVESATYFHGADAAAISEAVLLPAWNVRRALHALGLGPDPRKPVRVKTAPSFGTTTRRPA